VRAAALTDWTGFRRANWLKATAGKNERLTPTLAGNMGGERLATDKRHLGYMRWRCFGAAAVWDRGEAGGEIDRRSRKVASRPCRSPRGDPHNVTVTLVSMQ
jgi:hypothetical protein